MYHSTGNAAKLAEYTRILQEWNFLRDTKDNEQVGKDFVTSCLMFKFIFKFSLEDREHDPAMVYFNSSQNVQEPQQWEFEPDSDSIFYVPEAYLTHFSYRG